MVTFRLLTRDDFALLARWLAEPHVHRWWNHEFTPEAIERDFGPVIDGEEPGKVYVALEDNNPVGVMQYCWFADYPEYVEEMNGIYPVGDGAATIDYFIGVLDRVGKGLGSTMIAAFSEYVWRHDVATKHIVVPVHARNEASWRALLKAGYRLVAQGEMEPDNPEDDRAHQVLRLDRPITTTALRGNGRRPWHAG